jgi:hypothetical protein
MEEFKTLKAELAKAILNKIAMYDRNLAHWLNLYRMEE